MEFTDPESPENIENRDYLQMEKDAWAARTEIGDIADHRHLERVLELRDRGGRVSRGEGRDEDQRRRTSAAGSCLSPSAQQMVVHTGHAVEEEDPDLVIDAILDVYDQAG